MICRAIFPNPADYSAGCASGGLFLFSRKEIIIGMRKTDERIQNHPVQPEGCLDPRDYMPEYPSFDRDGGEEYE